MTIRAVRPEDLDAIQGMEAAAAGAAHWDRLDYLRYGCTVAEADGGKVAGFLLFRKVADGEFEILNLAVAPAFRRKGVAGALLRDALGQAEAHWFLEVRASNFAARNLYKSLGFQELGTRPDYYADPSEGAIVMSVRS